MFKAAAVADVKSSLEQESRARPGQWARRVLGADSQAIHLSMRLLPRKRRWELMIWQNRVPVTLGEHSAWERRVNELRHQMSIVSWRRLDDVVRDDIVAAAFTQSVHDAADLKR